MMWIDTITNFFAQPQRTLSCYSKENLQKKLVEIKSYDQKWCWYTNNDQLFNETFNKLENYIQSNQNLSEKTLKKFIDTSDKIIPLLESKNSEAVRETLSEFQNILEREKGVDYILEGLRRGSSYNLGKNIRTIQKLFKRKMFSEEIDEKVLDLLEKMKQHIFDKEKIKVIDEIWNVLINDKGPYVQLEELKIIAKKENYTKILPDIKFFRSYLEQNQLEEGNLHDMKKCLFTCKELLKEDDNQHFNEEILNVEIELMKKIINNVNDPTKEVFGSAVFIRLKPGGRCQQVRGIIESKFGDSFFIPKEVLKDDVEEENWEDLYKDYPAFAKDNDEYVKRLKNYSGEICIYDYIAVNDLLCDFSTYEPGNIGVRHGNDVKVICLQTQLDLPRQSYIILNGEKIFDISNSSKKTDAEIIRMLYTKFFNIMGKSTDHLLKLIPQTVLHGITNDIYMKFNPSLLEYHPSVLVHGVEVNVGIKYCLVKHNMIFGIQNINNQKYLGFFNAKRIFHINLEELERGYTKTSAIKDVYSEIYRDYTKALKFKEMNEEYFDKPSQKVLTNIEEINNEVDNTYSYCVIS